jgi:stearoyl-CoA desaturase (delta-9 desaturase)
MFAVTAFYHRYFSHRPLWWAAHHRHHHAASDQEDDVHSPVTRSFIWSHIGWITSSKNMTTNYNRVRDFDSYPELRFINRFDWMMPACMVVGLYLLGEYLRHYNPLLGTSGLQLLVWGFFVSTTILFHATSSINSLSHLLGFRRYDTGDHSRNNPILALITFGEGWHNNHHKFSSCARQGFAWWEVDITYYGLVLLAWLGIISDLKPVPSHWNTEAKSTAALRSPITQGRRQ